MRAQCRAKSAASYTNRSYRSVVQHGAAQSSRNAQDRFSAAIFCKEFIGVDVTFNTLASFFGARCAVVSRPQSTRKIGIAKSRAAVPNGEKHSNHTISSSFSAACLPLSYFALPKICDLHQILLLMGFLQIQKEGHLTKKPSPLNQSRT